MGKDLAKAKGRAGHGHSLETKACMATRWVGRKRKRKRKRSASQHSAGQRRQVQSRHVSLGRDTEQSVTSRAEPSRERQGKPRHLASPSRIAVEMENLPASRLLCCCLSV